MYSVGTRAFGVAAIAVLLATAGIATAQSFSVALEPTGSVDTLSPGDSGTVEVEVNLQGDEFSCASDEELPVNVTVAQTRGVSGSAEPAQLVFSNTQGIHNSGAPTGGYNETQTTSVTVQAASTASGGDRDVQITGVFPGGNYGPPQGSCGGEFPSAKGTVGLTVTVESTSTGGDTGGTDGGTDDGTGDTGGTGGNGTTGGNTTDGEEENGLPVGTWVAPAALVSAALALRRRHES